MTAAYELALLGEPSAGQEAEIGQLVGDMVAQFGLTLGTDVAWHVRPAAFEPSALSSAAALFFGGPGAVPPAGLAEMRRSVPVVPVVSALARTSAELPAELRGLNAL